MIARRIISLTMHIERIILHSVSIKFRSKLVCDDWSVVDVVLDWGPLTTSCATTSQVSMLARDLRVNFQILSSNIQELVAMKKLGVTISGCLYDGLPR